jgi:hypothetical protein
MPIGTAVRFNIVDIGEVRVDGKIVDPKVVEKAVAETVNWGLNKVVDDAEHAAHGLPISAQIQIERAQQAGDTVQGNITAAGHLKFVEEGTGRHAEGVHVSARGPFRIEPRFRKALLIPLPFASGMRELSAEERKRRVITIGGRQYVFSASAMNPGQVAQHILRKALNRQRGAIREKMRSDIARAVAGPSAYRKTTMQLYITVGAAT